MSSASQPFHGDRPIEDEAEDRLGFGPAARHVANAINNMASPDGFVIGVEGEWGSGKSSFINLVSDALLKAESAPEVIRFLPWLISSRDGMLKELFAEISKSAIRIDLEEPPQKGLKKVLGKIWPHRHSAQKSRKRRLRKLLSRFSSRLVNAGKLAEAFGLAGVGVAAEVGKKSFDEWLDDSSLEGEKVQVQAELRSLTRKIVVFIDDLDRLEPHEVAEVLRLVRAVVDFPNVVFVLCYSRDIIAKNLAIALSIDKGEEFLEKIVQVSFSVPRPEAFDLRRMLRHELQLLYPDLLARDGPNSRTIRDRLAYGIDDEGGRALLTPRHVVRAVNAMRFHATPVIGNIDISDMAWLQLVRIQSPKLYQWIEGYLIEFSAKHAGARIGEEGRASDLNNLNAIIDEMESRSASRSARLQALVSNLPGVSYDFERENGQTKMTLSLFGNDDLTAYVRDKRLGSPQHFRYYFALTVPQNSISDQEFATFLENANSSQELAVDHFARLTSTVTSQGRLACQPLMDRLMGSGIESAQDTALAAILAAVAESMDLAALQIGRGEWGEYWIWRSAESLMLAIWRRIPGEQRLPLAKAIFSSAASLGWLTDVFRKEIFAHGIYGGKPEPEREWLLSQAELEIAANELLLRYRNIVTADLPKLPRVAPILYAWIQYDPDALPEIKAKVESLSKEDEGFLALLHGMRNWQASNGVVSYPLVEKNLDPFFNIDEVRARLLTLTKHEDEVLAAQSRELLSALVAGD